MARFSAIAWPHSVPSRAFSGVDPVPSSTSDVVIPECVDTLEWVLDSPPTLHQLLCLRNARAFPLLPAALASVPFGFVLVRVRVRHARRRATINVVDFSDVTTCQNMVDVSDVATCQNIRKVSEHMYPDKNVM